MSAKAVKTASKISRIKEANSERGEKRPNPFARAIKTCQMVLATSWLCQLQLRTFFGNNHQRISRPEGRNCPAMVMLSFALKKMGTYVYRGLHKENHEN